MVLKYKDYSEVDERIFRNLLDNDIARFTRNANGINIRNIVKENSIDNKKLKMIIINNDTRKKIRQILFKATSDTSKNMVSSMLSQF